MTTKRVSDFPPFVLPGCVVGMGVAGSAAWLGWAWWQQTRGRLFDLEMDAEVGEVRQQLAARALRSRRHETVNAFAAVEGAAVGLGLLIAASADILVTSRSASFRMPEVTLGIASDVDGLRRFLPEMWVRRLCLSGEPFTAEQLHLEASGAMVCEPGMCEATAEAIVGQLAALRPQFVRDAKLQLRR